MGFITFLTIFTQKNRLKSCEKNERTSVKNQIFKICKHCIEVYTCIVNCFTLNKLYIRAPSLEKYRKILRKDELISQIPCTATKDCKNSRQKNRLLCVAKEKTQTKTKKNNCIYSVLTTKCKTKCKIQVIQQNFDIMVKTWAYYNCKNRQTKYSNISLHRYVCLFIINDTYIY